MNDEETTLKMSKGVSIFLKDQSFSVETNYIFSNTKAFEYSYENIREVTYVESSKSKIMYNLSIIFGGSNDVSYDHLDVIKIYYKNSKTKVDIYVLSGKIYKKNITKFMSIVKKYIENS